MREKNTDDLPASSKEILQHMRESGHITPGIAMRLTRLRGPLFKQHMDQLLSEGYVFKHGSGRGTWYSLRSQVSQKPKG